MNDFLKKMMGQITKLWGQWSMIQRVILIGIVAVVIGGIATLMGVSSTPSLAPVINAPIRDQDILDRIIMRINEEGVNTDVTTTGIVRVADEMTARRMRGILIRENLIPKNIDPWAIFDTERWTNTDFERKVNFRRAQTRMITDHIKAIDGIDDASVVIEVPEKELFRPDQNPVTASVIITPRPGSDITTNRKKVEGIQMLLKLAVQGLKDENIGITDQAGNKLNNFDDMAAFDRLALIEKEQKHLDQVQAKYQADILRSLQATYGTDRVRAVNVTVEKDMSKKTVDTTEYFPFTVKPRTPGLAYDDSEIVKSVTLSSSTSETKWEGTGFNPEGPAGVEGQTPPSFKDLSNLYGKMLQETKVQNEAINKRNSQEDHSPQINRITVSVNIDGTWKWKYNEKRDPIIAEDGTIERVYTPVPDKELFDVVMLVQGAIGYNAARSDTVIVRNIKFDRTKEFGDQDAAYFRKKQMQTTIIVFLAGLTLLLLCFIIFRIVAREMERRRRLAEEERARREQALRESAMMEAEQEGGTDVSISVEERSRMELMESVVNLTKEHPEDCAQLIRTWLLEE